MQKDVLEECSLEHICFASEEGSSLRQVVSCLFTEECSLSGHFKNMKYTIQHIEVSNILSTLEEGKKKAFFAMGERINKQQIGLPSLYLFARDSNCVMKQVSSARLQ